MSDPDRHRRPRNAIIAGIVGLLVLAAALVRSETNAPAPPAAAAPAALPGQPSTLPLPSSLPVADYEARLFDFLNERTYQSLGWTPDKFVRDTGPFLNGKYYGTHPAVRVYYSPEIIAWLRDGKRTAIPDGAMIIKEQFQPPAVRCEGLDDKQLSERLASWAVMVKDSAGSHDGWFWSNPAAGQKVVDNHQYPFDHPISGFGIYCVRCHASTKTPGVTNEFTFASLRNIAGFPGKPLTFEVDDSWKAAAASEVPIPAEEPGDVSNEALLAPQMVKSADASHPRCTDALRPGQCTPLLNDGFLKLFPTIAARARGDVVHLPPETHDWVVRRPGKSKDSQPFVTSTQCMSCHAGLMAPFGPTMFVPTSDNVEYAAPGVDLSPYGEWRWTPMGLAGRDPIFYAQLESEIELLRADFPDDPKHAEEMVESLAETCLTCHASMGKHQFDVDHGGKTGHFSVAHAMLSSTDVAATGSKDWRYGALARDGVSCAVCHQMEPREQPAGDTREYLEFFLETSITGAINVGKPGELNGPFQDKEISPYAMEHALGFTPKYNPYIKSSQLCGTCHVVNLPICDTLSKVGEEELIASERHPTFKKFHHHVEQATYLEWLNSEFENEINVANPQAKTCQDCHMKRDYHNDDLALHLDKIETRLAAIQDNTYPEAESLAERETLEVRKRSEAYSRHNFRGLNVFLLEMFNQFDDVLGVRKFDYMTGSTSNIKHATADFLQQARNDVATIAVDARVTGSNELTATVDLQNKVGHRFPSGVGFRRAFLELLIVEPATNDAPERIVWSSGRTNEFGMLVDADGKPLPSETFADNPMSGKQTFQPHHEVITSSDEVQIYETLLANADHRFTTSFVHGGEVVKDNRLLPRGWTAAGPGPALNGEFLQATYPDPTARKDPRYANGSGSDEVTYRVQLPAGTDPRRLSVKATLYYQAIPPYFLRSAFETAPGGPATQRLHYICSNIDLRGTPIENWKLAVTSAMAAVTPK
jgi:hypothetical protein